MTKHTTNKTPDPDLADFDDMPMEDVAGEEQAAKPEKPQITYPSHEELNQEISALEGKVLRYQAELDNMHKRNVNEIEKVRKFGSERVFKDLLPVVDSLERALEQKATDDAAGLRTGVELTLKLLQDTLARFSLKELNPKGQMFDPALHEAMSMQETKDQPPGTILNVLLKGFLLHDRLLRPAMVIVAKAPEAK